MTTADGDKDVVFSIESCISYFNFETIDVIRECTDDVIEGSVHTLTSKKVINIHDMTMLSGLFSVTDNI